MYIYKLVSVVCIHEKRDTPAPAPSSSHIQPPIVSTDSSNEAGLDTRWFWAPVPFRTDGKGEEEAGAASRSDSKLVAVAGESMVGRERDRGDYYYEYDESHDQDRCTALFKATPGGGDVVVAHTTFDYYVTAWQRLVKDVSLPVLTLSGGNESKPPPAAAAGQQQPPLSSSSSSPVGEGRVHQCFSASAGQVASLDDFYLVRGEVRGLGIYTHVYICVRMCVFLGGYVCLSCMYMETDAD